MKGLFLRLLPAGASALALMAMTAQASADAAGDKVLASVDAALNRWKTQYIKYDVTNQEPGKPERKLELEVKLKAEKRLTEFLAPADMKGTKVLILSSTQMYVYLPAFGKVRRIASSVTDQGFMGLTFTQTDLSLTRYSADYTAGHAQGGQGAALREDRAHDQQTKLAPDRAPVLQRVGHARQDRDPDGLYVRGRCLHARRDENGRPHQGRPLHEAHAQGVESK